MTGSLISFVLPQDLNATAPPERRGLRRDFVRMMVLDRKTGQTVHSHFYKLDQFLNQGDLLVLNESRTIPAVLRAEWRSGGILRREGVEVRLARRLEDGLWDALVIADGIAAGDVLHFSPQLQAVVLERNKPFVSLQFSLRGPALYDQIYALGEPVRYEYIHNPWGLDYYQTVYASVPGSVEMPSAGRAFSWELMLRLKRKGIGIAYLQLHTGLSYLPVADVQQNPGNNFEEYRIPKETVEAIRQAKEAGGRVIAVGTTVVRALETVAHQHGRLVAQTGWTNLHIDAHFPLRVTDGLITGFHEPEASHLDLLSAFIAPELLVNAYQEAIRLRYLWHEFGDVNLIL